MNANDVMEMVFLPVGPVIATSKILVYPDYSLMPESHFQIICTATKRIFLLTTPSNIYLTTLDAYYAPTPIQTIILLTMNI